MIRGGRRGGERRGEDVPAAQRHRQQKQVGRAGLPCLAPRSAAPGTAAAAAAAAACVHSISPSALFPLWRRCRQAERRRPRLPACTSVWAGVPHAPAQPDGSLRFRPPLRLTEGVNEWCKWRPPSAPPVPHWRPRQRRRQGAPRTPHDAALQTPPSPSTRPAPSRLPRVTHHPPPILTSLLLPQVAERSHPPASPPP